MLVHRNVDAGDTRHLALHHRAREKAGNHIRKPSKYQSDGRLDPLKGGAKRLDNSSALALLVPRIGRANDVHDAAAPHDFAVLADLLDRRTNFHFLLPMPRRLAFFIKPSYWCDIKCDWVCATKSMTPTTMINKEVPPNWNGTLGFTMRMISGSKHTAMM